MRHTSPTFNRRTALGLLGAAAVAAPAIGQARATEGSLGALARAKGIRFGTAVGFGALNDPKIQELIARECDIMVPENELKMYVTHNNNATDYNFAPADRIHDFAKANNIAMRGHTIFWARDEYTPQWLKAYDFGAKPKVAAEKMLREYVAKIADHYGDQLVSWDVVNETIDPATGEVRSNVFSRILGMDALRISFEVARERLPKTQLVYNDYMGWEKGGEKHRQGVLTLMRWFRENKIEVDALGVQGHIGTDHDLTLGQAAEWRAFLDGVTSLGYDLLVTEFDVNDRYLPADIATRDSMAAKVAREYLDTTLSYKQVKDFLIWTITDKYSWLQGFSPRTDKLPLRPTPFDADGNPKPIYDAIAAAFKAAPAR
ncbi:MULTISPECIES: endo-1,4-beta-xylanase [Asticcacaulis]|uniref:endo-1,4-beta-xylanase n=1 Tax=Asticcacaulis TaxID=76890 RepID=UPI001AE885F9|nr:MULTISPECIES: endo-1,4-beta-xylanase [Asticcacaulis]MBP2161372.1 endo-1,4-beta-xylanase [Asticcacaulis solisilvae]MDR6802417.1 endo-1,4-beta-xylanase [Asticcacaulis sp. BE141]